VVHSGAWAQLGNATQFGFGFYKNTIHLTNSTNSKATLTFTGISSNSLSGMNELLDMFQYILKKFGRYQRHGVWPCCAARRSTSGVDPTLITEAARGRSALQGPAPTLLETSPILRNGQHDLTIENLNGINSTFCIDNFVIVTSGGASTITSTFTTMSSSIIPTRPSTNSYSRSQTSSSVGSASFVTPMSFGSSGTFVDVPLASTAQSGNDSDAPTTPHNKSHNRTAAIIGAIIASCIVIFFIMYLWLRRWRKQQESEPWIFSSCQ
jgi:hypothetical protein